MRLCRTQMSFLLFIHHPLRSGMTHHNQVQITFAERRRGESRANSSFLKAWSESCTYHFSLCCIGKPWLLGYIGCSEGWALQSLAGQCVFSRSLGSYCQEKVERMVNNWQSLP